MDEAAIEHCHRLVDELVQLHQETDPLKGEQTEEKKFVKAYEALDKISELSFYLTEWAEHQIIGAHISLVDKNKQLLSFEECSSHKNENTGRYSDRYAVDEKYIPALRAAIARFLRLSIGKKRINNWRTPVEIALFALNLGQTDDFFKPQEKRKVGKSYDILELKWAAVFHVHKLWGEGNKKEYAIQKVAEECDVTHKAIENWEKSCVKEGKDKKELFWIKGHL
ncbi:MAG: hypothetical protein EOM26_09180 [Alphaproteobacteria bacterium]|nr:hypothetical protein [Alphaproteobacteria bacterium]